jgi:hypothetical protein
MNDDLGKIAEMLRARFPRCEVKTMRSGDHGPNPLATVYFPSVGDEVFAIGDDPAKGKKVYMGVNEHVRNEDFKPDGWDLFDFGYQGPKHLVGKFVEGAWKMSVSPEEAGQFAEMMAEAVRVAREMEKELEP